MRRKRKLRKPNANFIYLDFSLLRVYIVQKNIYIYQCRYMRIRLPGMHLTHQNSMFQSKNFIE